LEETKKTQSIGPGTRGEEDEASARTVFEKAKKPDRHKKHCGEKKYQPRPAGEMWLWFKKRKQVWKTSRDDCPGWVAERRVGEKGETPLTKKSAIR